ncbi:PepSY domain-containing protein [Fictibacillus norfolkensis]|uniref:PepSY domain-containing protein n=1 Tax=Fictibacillus norfolkensis TaxID=2762233 RepID=A0ABR8SKJ8_9BACL|nr:PepSY domain-containing protein [Fictibacillus norfolkensis]MBD7963874.1 PepSY domain-containing protein [Fictibacillus norfolkensis]
MNKKTAVIFGIIIVILLLVFGTREWVNGNQGSTLEKEKMNRIISAKYPGEILSTELTNREDNRQYKTVLKSEQGVYVIWSDAVSGEILDMNRTDDEVSQGKSITKDEAEKIAAEHGDVKSLEFNEENKVYLVRVQNEGKIYRLEINGTTGDLKSKNEVESGDEPAQPNTKISEEEAKQIALKEVKGSITDIELDDEDGVIVYEVEIVTKTKEAQVIINAFSGEVNSITMETKDSD